MAAESTEALREQLAELTRVVAAQTATIERLTTAAKPAPALTVRELYDRYQLSRRTEHSWVSIRNRLRPLLRRLGDRPVTELTPAVWADHRATRKQEETSRERPPADHTLNIELQRTKEMLDFAVAGELLEFQSAEGGEARQDDLFARDLPDGAADPTTPDGRRWRSDWTGQVAAARLRLVRVRRPPTLQRGAKAATRPDRTRRRDRASRKGDEGPQAAHRRADPARACRDRGRPRGRR